MEVKPFCQLLRLLDLTRFSTQIFLAVWAEFKLSNFAFCEFSGATSRAGGHNTVGHLLPRLEPPNMGWCTFDPLGNTSICLSCLEQHYLRPWVIGSL